MLFLSKTMPASKCAYHPSYILCDSSNFQYYLGQIGWIVCTLGRRVCLDQIQNDDQNIDGADHFINTHKTSQS